MSHHIVEARHLHHIYPDGTTALKDVSFRVHHGESVAIIGANGAGKSTLLLHLNGYLGATSGEVVVGDLTVSKKNLVDVRRTVGMVFQDPDDQLFMPTVFDDVAFGPMNMGLPKSEVERRVKDALDRVGAQNLTDRPPYHLSGGEKKRVAIASVLSMLPEILILDEPTSGLDPCARRQLMAMLRAFHHTRIITSHDLDMVMELCERTIVLHEGQVMADGPTLEIFRDESLLDRCCLEKPFAMQNCPNCSPKTIDNPAQKPLIVPHPDKPHHHSHNR
ncbi:MAG: ABC transporter ATP-binding protein [Deltaproteobacteria bacterium]|nr:ABC transporter ATP-binding protein [Deltaproteobacteria bacterium]MBW2520236.1 ABC transporter ATP-binding protein [Deltaproteobacteria bacterium]